MDGKQEPSSRKAYGGKSALSFERDFGKEKDARLSVQGAPCIGEKKYDWSKKIVVQLNDRECRSFYAVLAGCIPKFEAAQHGPAKDKTFSIEAQPGKFFVKVMQAKSATGGGMHAVPVEPVDASYVSEMILRQLQVNSPWMTCMEIHQSIVNAYSTCANAKPAAARA